MPIKGRTDTPIGQHIDLQVVGRLWKGEAKTGNNAGKDLKNKFRFEAPDHLRERFEEAYGSSYPEQIRIYLPHRTTDQVFETWNEAHTAQGFQKRCDGENIIQEMQPYKVKSGKSVVTKWQRVNVDKPCMRGDRPLCDDCSTQGRFFFYVRELYATGMGSTKCFMMTVTGSHDITGFTEQLRAIEAKYGGLMGSPIPSPLTYGYIPFVLTRIEKQISRPNGEFRARGTAWVLSISEDPEWLAALQRYYQAVEMQRLLGERPEVQALLLPSVGTLPEIAPTDNGRTRIYNEIGMHQNRLGLSQQDVFDLAQATVTHTPISHFGQLSDSQLDDLLLVIRRQQSTTVIEADVIDEDTRNAVNAAIKVALKSLSWEREKGLSWLQENFGVESRDELDLDGLIELRDRLEVLVSETTEV